MVRLGHAEVKNDVWEEFSKSGEGKRKQKYEKVIKCKKYRRNQIIKQEQVIYLSKIIGSMKLCNST